MPNGKNRYDRRRGTVSTGATSLVHVGGLG